MRKFKILPLLLLLLTMATSAVAQKKTQKTYIPWDNGKLVVSEEGRYLKHENGAPFFWLGETGWLLPERLNRDEAEYYLEQCKRRGYNVIRFVLITLCQKLAVCFCLFYSHLAPVHRASPNADHTDILSLLCCCTDDVIHVIPITVYAFLIDVFEVVSVNHRILSVDIHRRNIVQRLNLNHVISATFTLFQVIFGFIPVQAFGQ